MYICIKKKIKCYCFVEDVAASGGYWLACSADEIYADINSIVGSIGVISGGFGLVWYKFVQLGTVCFSMVQFGLGSGLQAAPGLDSGLQAASELDSGALAAARAKSQLSTKEV